MDLLPALRVGLVGAAGYLYGEYNRCNPKMTGVIWLTIEAVSQIFYYFNNRQLSETNKIFINVLEGVVAAASMQYMHFISTLPEFIIAAAACALSAKLAACLKCSNAGKLVFQVS